MPDIRCSIAALLLGMLAWWLPAIALAQPAASGAKPQQPPAQAPAKAPPKPADACEFGAADRDAVIAACTRLITAGKLRGERLSDAYSARAEAYSTKNDYPRAIADADAAIRAHPGVANDLANRAKYKHASKDYDGAIADYTAALRITPDDDTFAGRGFSLLAKLDYARALPDFETAIELSSNTSSHYVGRGLAQRGLGQYRRAIADFSSATRYPPVDPEAVCDRGVAYFYDGNFSDAIADLSLCAKGPDYPYMRIWRYIAQARSSGDGGAIRRELDARDIMGREWPGPVRSMLMGRITPEAMLAAAADPDPEKAKGQACEARYYLGQFHLIRGEPGPAKQRLGEARDTCPRGFLEYQGALAELKRLAGK